MRVAYDGAAFRGWQRQPGVRTVQGELEKGVCRIVGHGARVVGAGRTDAGVHATGQVAHFDTRWTHGLHALQRALNAALPRDLVVDEIAEVAETFHARHSAIGRAYRYVVLPRPLRDPLRRARSYHVRRALDVTAMQAAASRLIGSHDFAGFGRPMTPGGPTQRRMDRVDVSEQSDEVWIELEANAFLRHQVRRTVGLLCDVGVGKEQPAVVDAVLRNEAGAPTARRAPAQGLVLTAVRYPPDEAIQRRAEAREME